MHSQQTILMPATPPTGHRLRLALRTVAGVAMIALPLAVALVILAILLV
jgi:hypothetical protein